MKYKVTVEIEIDDDDLEEYAEENDCCTPEAEDLVFADLQMSSFCCGFNIVDVVKE